MLIPAMVPLFSDNAHLTVVYGGEDPEPDHALRMQLMMRHAATRVEPFAAATMGVNLRFGEDKNEPVLLVGLSPELVILRTLLKQFSRSQYDEFRPHIAVPDWYERFQRCVNIPRHVYFTQIQFWLADDVRVSLWLGTGAEVK
jgi:hypothetical protein